jgi:hypothetical protein
MFLPLTVIDYLYRQETRITLAHFGSKAQNVYTTCTQCIAMKTSQFRIRVDNVLRQTFVDACKEIDRPASQVLREFMKQFVESQNVAAQSDLFENQKIGNKE